MSKNLTVRTKSDVARRGLFNAIVGVRKATLAAKQAGQKAYAQSKVVAKEAKSVAKQAWNIPIN